MSKSLLKFLMFGLLLISSQTYALTLSSSAFNDGGKIPAQYTCDGKNQSPPLSWQDPPAGVHSYVLIVDDPDAPGGTWNHWLVFNIPSSTLSLSQNEHVFPAGALIGKNNWHHVQYDGPCPPNDSHRYIFKLYALDTTLKLSSGATKSAVMHGINNHIIGSASLTGNYQRPGH